MTHLVVTFESLNYKKEKESFERMIRVSDIKLIYKDGNRCRIAWDYQMKGDAEECFECFYEGSFEQLAGLIAGGMPPSSLYR